jgi:hypothetical protein
LEGGTVDDEGAILVIPYAQEDGIIYAQFPNYKVKDGNEFKATIGCQDHAPKCNVTFEVLYREEGETHPTSLGTWTQKSDNSVKKIAIDLSPLAGKNVQFYLLVQRNGTTADYKAFWLAARITK